jgi:hypothetical protein
MAVGSIASTCRVPRELVRGAVGLLAAWGRAAPSGAIARAAAGRCARRADGWPPVSGPPDCVCGCPARTPLVSKGVGAELRVPRLPGSFGRHPQATHRLRIGPLHHRIAPPGLRCALQAPSPAAALAWTASGRPRLLRVRSEICSRCGQRNRRRLSGGQWVALTARADG